jgi:DNA recombination protein RmuC
MITILAGAILLGIVAIIILQVTSGRNSPAPSFPPELSEVRTGITKLQTTVEFLERTGKEDASRLRSDLAGQNQAFKLEIASALGQVSDSTRQKLESFNSDANQKIELLRKSIAESGVQLQAQVSSELEKVRAGITQASEQTKKTIEERLEQMRQTVDEKLQTTLETRLGESFRTVNDQINAVQRGLGEMQSLASGVTELRRVLTDVRARGVWGEVQLGGLLEEILTPDQYEKNVAVTGTNERVEFAIRLPGKHDGQPRWLAIDAKFPSEDYQRILDAAGAGDPAALDKACQALEKTIRTCAKDISAKYISEPKTMGFAILFLATEGLFAEALRRPGLADGLQRDFNVILTGPSTFSALLTSLRVGFQTLAIEQKAGEIKAELLLVKSEFEKYFGSIVKARKRLQLAASAVEAVEKNAIRLRHQLKEMQSTGGPSGLADDLDDNEAGLALSAGEA